MLGGKNGRTLFMVAQRWFGPDRVDELVGARKGQGHLVDYPTDWAWSATAERELGLPDVGKVVRLKRESMARQRPDTYELIAPGNPFSRQCQLRPSVETPVVMPPSTSRTSAARSHGSQRSTPIVGSAESSRTPSDFQSSAAMPPTAAGR